MQQDSVEKSTERDSQHDGGGGEPWPRSGSAAGGNRVYHGILRERPLVMFRPVSFDTGTFRALGPEEPRHLVR
jgi:hypothetical protein